MPDIEDAVEYRDIEGFPGYRVGNDGSVWSRWRKVGLGRGPGTKQVLGDSWKRLNPDITPFGYPRVTLYCDKRPTGRVVHQIVLEAFVGPRPHGMMCRHFPDRDPANNRIGNLQWGTAKQNQQDRIAHGTNLPGEQNPRAKLTTDAVLAIRAEYAAGGTTFKRLGLKYGVSDQKVYQIVHRKAWKYI